MSIYSKRSGIIVSIIVALIIWLTLNFFLIRSKEVQKKDSEYNLILNNNQIIENEKNEEDVQYIENVEEETDTEYIEKGIIVNREVSNDWNIFIPKINLIINIDEIDESEFMPRGLYHYPYSNKWNGNVVIMNNEWDKHNLYDALNKIEIGDSIEYKYEGMKREYKVIEKAYNFDIKASHIQETEDNRLTISTYSNALLGYDICIQAKPEI